MWLGLSIIPLLLLSCAAVFAADLDETYAEKVSRMHVFGEPLRWCGVGEPTEDESKALYDLAQIVEKQRLKPTLIEVPREDGGRTIRRAPIKYELLEGFIAEHPDSGWTPSVRAYLGKWYRQQGRYTRALEHWEKAWESTKEGNVQLSTSNAESAERKQVADFALAHWSSLLASLGRVDALKEIFEATKGRGFSEPYLQQMFDAAGEGYRSMLMQPEFSFQCGTYALQEVAMKLTNVARLTNAPGLLGEPSPRAGFTLEALVKIAERNGLQVAAVKRPKKGSFTEGSEACASETD